ncbi:unnamed protein product [Bursaphelenchus xylophilus]|uniref:(pine wood nematode) hypothetical protein n=1 Tax=Bursaphelenchus xylophilus TaxID=6326 RepID=A0A1I7SUZ4_BURXY|nr:unnamed protein product [Bursaphelenchus xylophilus]CAG9100654.1 unnamed protein product [Bursaphelenchus xylophilus]
MGASLCKPRPKKRITTSSWIASENENPFETNFTKKERVCLRETYQRLNDAKEIVGLIFVDLIMDQVPEMKKVFGADRVPKVNMIKMPKLGGHVARMTDFLEQMTSMLGFTENIIGAWQLARKTGRLHTKVPFLMQNQDQMGNNYFQIICDAFVNEFIPYLTGDKPDPTNNEPEDKKKVRFAQSYTPQQVQEVWKRFFIVVTGQLTEAFEIERQKGLNADNQKTLAPHQHVEAAEHKRKQLASEKQSEQENTHPNERGTEEMFEDPF